MKTKPTREAIQAIADAQSRVRMMHDLQIAPSTFYRYCRLYGIEYRNRHSSYQLSADDDENIQMLIEAGISLREIARKMGVCHTSIIRRRDRAEAGLPAKIHGV